MIRVNLVRNNIHFRRAPRANDQRCIITRRLHHMTFWTAHKIVQAMQSTLVVFKINTNANQPDKIQLQKAYQMIAQFTENIEKKLAENKDNYIRETASIGGDCVVIFSDAVHPHIFAAYLGFQLRDIVNTHPPLRTEKNMNTLFDLVAKQLVGNDLK